MTALFMALAEPLSPEQLEAFSPRLMSWDSQTWILDLTPTVSYWRKKAEGQGQSLTAQLSSQFHSLRHGSTRHDLHFPTLQVSLAANPWQAILLLHSMREHKALGLLSDHSSTGQHLLQQVSWPGFWKAISTLKTHLQPHLKGGTFSLFHSHTPKLQRSISRLQLKTPRQLQQLPHSAFVRRFGTVWGQIWQWMFGSVSYWEMVSGFGWRSWQAVEKATIHRHLDWPFRQWQEMAPLLCEDLSQLAKKQLDGQALHSLTWHLILESQAQTTLTLVLRHPHNLCTELTHHRTILGHLAHHFAQWSATVDPHTCLAEWTLQADWTTLTTRPHDLWGELQFHNQRQQVETESPIALRQYQMVPNWQASASYRGGEKKEDTPLTASLSAAGKSRPLFLFKSPPPVALSGHPQPTEQTMTPWWQTLDDTLEQHYYHWEAHHRHYWITQTADGQWQAEGIFG